MSCSPAWVGLLSFCLVLCAAGCQRAGDTPTGPATVQLDITAGQTVPAQLHRAPEPMLGVVVLAAHNSGCETWQPLQARIADKATMLCVALAPADPVRLSAAAALDVLLDEGIAPGRLVIAAEGEHGRAALEAAAGRDEVGGVALLSPGASDAGDLVRETVGLPLLLLAAEGDAFAATAATAIHGAAPERSELRLYPGGAHGADLLAASPQALSQTVLWLEGVARADIQLAE